MVEAAKGIKNLGQDPRKKRKLNLHNLRPKRFDDKEDVIIFTDLRKEYTLEGRDEKIVALKHVSLSPKEEFYPIKK